MDVAELLLRVIGDSDGTSVSVCLDPLVLFRIFAICRIRHESL